MAYSYSKTAPQMMEDKQKPSQTTLQFILNYSKSVEAKKTKKGPVMVHLN